jgi:hypothetical protein
MAISRKRILFALDARVRYLNLAEQDLVSRDLMAQPLALRRLAAFLYDAHYQQKMKLIPIVLAGPKNANDMCTIVGYFGQPKAGSQQVARARGGGGHVSVSHPAVTPIPVTPGPLRSRSNAIDACTAAFTTRMPSTSDS